MGSVEFSDKRAISPRLHETPSAEAGLTPSRVEKLWGAHAKGQASGGLGMSAALWDCNRIDQLTLERLRPSCSRTHVLSVWVKGSTVSELFLDDKLRFRRVRRRGTFQLARAGEDLRVILSETSGACLDIYLPVALLQSTIETAFEKVASSLELLPLKLETDPAIARMADEILAEIETPQIGSRVAIDSASLALSVRLVRRWSSLSGNIRPRTATLTEFQLRRIIDFFNSAVDADVSLDDAARIVGLSPFHFARAFKNAVGVPPHRYQVELRLKRASELLKKNGLSVGEVATLVGYGDASYFARAFKQRYNVSPATYRRILS